MDDLIRQSLRNRKLATIDHRSSRRRGNSFYMAGAATKPAKELLALDSSRSCSKRYISRWNHRAAYELSKVIDVSQAKFIWLIVNARRSVKNLSNFHGAQPVRDAHLIEIGICNKGE